MGPLESRLSESQIAELDQMNARVFGLPIDPSAPPPDLAAPPAAPAAPAAPPPPAAQTPPTPPPTGFDEFTPPDEAAPAAAADTPPAAPTDEFPDRKVLFPDDAIDKLRTDKAKTDIRKLGEHYDKAVVALKERDGQLEELRKKIGTGDNALVDQLNARIAELSAIVEKKSILDHPGFIRDFVEPRKAEVARAAKVLELADIEKPMEVLEKAMGLQGRERIAAFDQLYDNLNSPSLRTRLENAIEKIEVLDEKRSEFLANREGNAAKIAAEEKAREMELRQQQETWAKSTIDKVFDHLATKSSFFKKANKPGYEAWDKGYDEDRANIEELALRNDDPGKLLAAITLGVRASRILGAYAKKSAQVAQLQREIDQLRGARPSINGDKVGGERHEAPQDPQESLVSAARRVMHDISSGL